MAVKFGTELCSDVHQDLPEITWSEETWYYCRCATIFSCTLGPVQMHIQLSLLDPPCWTATSTSLVVGASYRGGMNHRNLHLLGPAPVSNNLIMLWMSLLNTRSLANKTFILNYFLYRQNWILYSWRKLGFDLVSLLLSLNSFLRLVISQLSGKGGGGGGQASVFENEFHCRQLSPVFYPSWNWSWNWTPLPESSGESYARIWLCFNCCWC